MRSVWLPAALLGVGLLACSSNSTGSNNTTLDLTGTWTVTKYEFSQVAAPHTKTDFVTQGYTVTLVGTTNGWTVTATKTGQTASIDQGTYSSTASTITFINSKNTSEITAFSWTRSGNTITLTGGSGTFDFGSGTEEAATINITAVKQ